MAAFRGWTPTYGYFPILPFLLALGQAPEGRVVHGPNTSSALAQYPNTDFHYVGHSNGTYLAARSLKDYPALRFKNVLFAGSVVRCDFPWVDLVNEGRVARLQNIVAAGDWVVAWFPRSVEWIRAFDLGGAGFDGFDDGRLGRPEITDYAYVRGGHGAGIIEARWPDIARFVVGGAPYALPPGDPDAAATTDRIVAAIAAPRLLLPALAAVSLVLVPLAILFYPTGFDHGGWRSFILLVYAILLRFGVGRF